MGSLYRFLVPHLCTKTPPLYPASQFTTTSANPNFFLCFICLVTTVLCWVLTLCTEVCKISLRRKLEQMCSHRIYFSLLKNHSPAPSVAQCRKRVDSNIFSSFIVVHLGSTSMILTTLLQPKSQALDSAFFLNHK